MQHITLTVEQTRLLASAVEPVEIRDADGTVVGYLSPPSRAHRSAFRPSTEAIQARLCKLAEALQRDGLEDTGAMALLARLRSAAAQGAAPEVQG
jgi:hypothetical protein